MAYSRTFVTLTIRDDYGRTKTKQVEMLTADATQSELDAGTIKNAYQAAMDGHILKAQVNGLLEYTGSPAAGSNVDTGVTMKVQLDGRAERASLKWPTPAAAIINPDGTVDLNDLAVQGIEALYQTTGTNVARLSDGEAIEEFLSGTLDK